MDFDLLKRIVEAPGAPGFEHAIREEIQTIITPYVDHIHVDGMGNLIARSGPKEARPVVMAVAHMDEIGLISTHIDDSGFIRFHTLGGFDPTTLITQRVWVHTPQGEDLLGVIGSKPIHVQSAAEKKKVPKIKDLFIDVGLPKEQVIEKVPAGTPITRNRPLDLMGNCITGKSLDNRLSVYILIEALRKSNSTDNTFYAVFSTQEEVGIRGARTAAQAIQPDIGIALDVTLANDVPGSQSHEHCTKLGEGTAVKVLDKSVISTPELVRFISNLADEHDIKLQREVLTAGGTDTSAMQYLIGSSAHVSCISTPTRYIHSTTEVAHTEDINYSIDLMRHLIEQLHTYSQ
ncbi:MAG: M42 family metallopeptidase [Bacteroidota bacterium]